MTKIVLSSDVTTDDGYLRRRVQQQAVVLVDDEPVEVEQRADGSIRTRVGSDAEMLSTAPVPEGDPTGIDNASHVPPGKGPDSASRFKFACDIIVVVLRLLDSVPFILEVLAAARRLDAIASWLPLLH